MAQQGKTIDLRPLAQLNLGDQIENPENLSDEEKQLLLHAVTEVFHQAGITCPACIALHLRGQSDRLFAVATDEYNKGNLTCGIDHLGDHE